MTFKILMHLFEILYGIMNALGTKEWVFLNKHQLSQVWGETLMQATYHKTLVFCDWIFYLFIFIINLFIFGLFQGLLASLPVSGLYEKSTQWSRWTKSGTCHVKCSSFKHSTFYVLHLFTFVVRAWEKKILQPSRRHCFFVFFCFFHYI